MLFTFLVIDENFTVLAIAARLMLGGPDDCEYILCLLEDVVHLLEGTVSSFRVEEVDDWEDESITVSDVSTPQHCNG